MEFMMDSTAFKKLQDLKKEYESFRQKEEWDLDDLNAMADIGEEVFELLSDSIEL